MGDPAGIGPEVIVKTLASRELRRRAHFRIYGMEPVLADAADRAGIEPFWWTLDHASPLIDTARAHDVLLLDYRLPKGLAFPTHKAPLGPTRVGGELSFLFCEHAIAASDAGVGDATHVDAIVTAPVSKQSWALAGRSRYPGHTELLASRLRAKRVAMMFHSPRLNVVLVTTHIALMEIRDVMTIGMVFDAIDLGHEACRRLGVVRPRVAVCGLNPHAGEGGLFGDEEGRLIEPAIKVARAGGMDVSGPFPADTIFNAAVRGDYDLVVAMYHDQGLIPVKLLDRDRAVNVTLGLPTVRTSPDHGTAFDIAGKNKADPGSMAAAMELAIRLAGAPVPEPLSPRDNPFTGD